MSHPFILELYKKPQTIFTFKELSLFFTDISYQSLKNKIHYATRTGKLLSLRRGIYAKENWNIYEMANKIYTPSYISLETVLQKEGIIFQTYSLIFAVSYLTRKIKIKDQEIFYRKLTNHILLNKTGIKEEENFFMATKERAFLDSVYFYKDYHFDNLKPLDWQVVSEMVKIYQSKSLEKRIEEYQKSYQKEYV